ncbi:putative selenate reductase subunit YgfK [Oribacterium parvum]|uniref:putative selenate reductase subunit YgfK n=1 Tax=Oribacterium parvum TaxID=1501329 RepID=UPI0028DCA8B0|nr:putative selenate reductase subunit YgfK [Oribacterium parvum]
MSDIMTPIPFDRLMNRILVEHQQGAVFGMQKCYQAKNLQPNTLFGRKLEGQIGPAAGPNTQLAQNIVASYYGGARFFELKTVQKMDGRELAACVAKPCITAEDECYNCEWSTELEVPQAYAEYVKGWFACKVMAKEYDLGDPDAFQFNISVGYDLEGIKLPKVDRFINEMKDAKDTEIFKECKAWLLANLDRFKKVTKEDVDAIQSEIINSVTVSTLHGCPPSEIEAIASYLIQEKHLHTFVKCNPTLLGYETARAILDEMGYDYIAFTDFHFKDDLQYSDAVPMLKRLQELAKSLNLNFGVKITNTFPVDVKNNELPSQEMYMSGKSLFALSMSVAKMLTRDFNGSLRISFSGGADYFNIERIVEAGIWPVTMATTLLKTGGYLRFIQMAELLEKNLAKPWEKVDLSLVEKMIADAKKDKHMVKPVKPLPNRKSEKKVPLVDCFTMPCRDRCPIHQDITSYGRLVNEGKFKEALEVILDKNPLPFMTGNICTHTCQSACTRNHYETDVQIRSNKLIAARGGYDTVLPGLKQEGAVQKKVGVIGAGPAGISAAFFLARAGVEVHVYDKDAVAGGVVANVIPGFRIPAEEIQKDVNLAKQYGAQFHLGQEVNDIDAFRKENNFDAVILAIGAHKEAPLVLEKGEAYNALHFLADFKAQDGKLNLGKNVVVVGAGNTAMDVARAAKRNAGVENVYLVYRRTKRYMPADQEELEEAIEEGVIFQELLAPFTHENGKLLCHRMVLSDVDASGRRSVKESDEVVEVPCDTVIASIGEKVDGSFYEKNGIAVTDKGLPVLKKETNETSVAGVYAAGDGAFGASVIVKAIADAKLACEAILNKTIGTDRPSETTDEKIYAKKGNLVEPEKGLNPDKRCLTCDHICENCCDVCPNRANFAIKVPGVEMHQIIHVDYMCNECGNCETFCPYDSAPYKEKFTLFHRAEEMEDSTNDGFAFVDNDGNAIVRIGGEKMNYKVGDKNTKLFYRLAEIVDTVYNDYSYLLI